MKIWSSVRASGGPSSLAVTVVGTSSSNLRGGWDLLGDLPAPVEMVILRPLWLYTMLNDLTN
ncbi:uncharacterized protein STEHIDRAFT_119800 [Stereum hirsutum FP-91666 SS1]|uniref:uncharacterized protein n=1 Tax=Stereum hirsutum (strain FP-91666) TaxID=721885 RepID=UPI0004410637|nr:uncharacterized protein STEHIDRAFT_119800 [Stereum hirsutum FP-91666 SS1]EIM89039.1 hypothetical protein STEHIDRAFT_119800 [Stereum hirsutum FP-91666 SS1]